MGLRTSRRRHGRHRWTVVDVLWLLVPIASLLCVAAYFGASIALGVSPPFSVVDGHSMLPTFHTGDLVVVKSLPAQDVKVGDIVSVNTPEEARKEKDLPAEIVHRVVKREGGPSDLTFITQGDNNPGEDAFITRPDDIRGVVVSSVPGLGYPVLFFRSPQGLVFLGALGVALVGYFVIGAVERRQEAAELDNPRPAIEQLIAEQRQDRETLHELVGAIREYGDNLRSHTRAVQEMASAAQELARAAAEIRAAVDARGPAPRDRA